MGNGLGMLPRWVECFKKSGVMRHPVARDVHAGGETTHRGRYWRRRLKLQRWARPDGRSSDMQADRLILGRDGHPCRAVEMALRYSRNRAGEPESTAVEFSRHWSRDEYGITR